MNTIKRVGSASNVDLDKLILALASGGLAGAVAGLIARASMRVIALLAGMQPDFSVDGTFFILVAFAILGAPFGWLYAGVEYRIPLKVELRALVYSAVLLLASAIPLLLTENLEGELAVIDPWAIIGAFAPVYLTYGAVLGRIFHHPWIAQRKISGRRMSLFGPLAFATLAIFSLASFATLNDLGLPIPRGIASLYRSAGISYNASRVLRAASVMLLGFSYIGGTSWLFFSRSKSWMPRFAAIGLLAFAAGFFASRDIFLSIFGVGSFALWVGALVRAIGLISLVILIYMFPDGRFSPPWTLPAALAWSTLTFLWLMPLERPFVVPDSLLAGWVLLGLGSGLIAQWQRLGLLSDDSDRHQVVPVFSALTFTWLLTAMVWATALSTPLYRAIGSPRMPLTTVFSFGPYLLPWLLIPISLAFAHRRRGLWR